MDKIIICLYFCSFVSWVQTFLMEVKVVLKVVLKIVCKFFYILGPGWIDVNLGVLFGVGFGDAGVCTGWGFAGGGVGGFFWDGVKTL